MKMFWRKKKPKEGLQIISNPCWRFPRHIGADVFIPEGEYQGGIVDVALSEGKGVHILVRLDGEEEPLAIWIPFYGIWIEQERRENQMFDRINVRPERTNKENKDALSKIIGRRCRFEIKNRMVAGLDILPRSS